MISLALALAVLSALINAGWNVLLKASGDPLRTAARAMAIAVLLATPCYGLGWLLAGRPGMPLEAMLLAVLSGAIELAYFVLLSTAYSYGELSVVYPIARGTAPLLAVLAGITLLGEHLSVPALVGVGCLLAGMLLVRRPVAAGAALRPALLTGVSIACYSAVDSAGVHRAPPWLYGWMMWAWTALFLACWVWLTDRWRNDGRRGGDAADLASSIPRRTAGSQLSAREVMLPETSWRAAAVMGILILAAYQLVLLALRIAPLSVVAPAREAAVVLVTGWGVWRLREREGAWLRLAGAGGIVVGAILLAL